MTKRTIKLADNTISEEEIRSLAGWLQEGKQLTKGPLTREFEAEFAAYTGTKYGIMVNSGSSANLLMAYSLLEAGYLRNKKVIVPEMNTGQLVTVLRAEYLVPAKGLNKVSGQPFKIGEIEAAIHAALEQ